MDFQGLQGFRSRVRGLHSAVLLSLLCLFAFIGCNQTVYPERQSTFLHNSASDSITFWPPSLKYARSGDTVSFLVYGLRRGFECAKVVDMGWTWRDDTTHDSYTLRSLIEVPGDPSCALDIRGLDSLFKRSFFTTAGEKLYLQTSAEIASDSVLYLSGNGFTETFTHLVSAPDSARVLGNRFWFFDSGATRTRRFLTADSMATCETFQSAAFKRSGDTLRVTVKRIEADPLSPLLYPPCSGPHADTVEVSLDAHRFP